MKWVDMTSMERDRLVAEKVMGWKPDECDGGIGELSTSPDGWFCQKCGYSGYWGDDFAHEELPLPYTTSLDMAWKIINKMDNVGVIYITIDNRKVYCIMYSHATIADTPAEAICLAALKAVGVEVEV